MPQTLFRRLLLLQWERGCFFSLCPTWRLSWQRPACVRGASLSDGKRNWIGNKLNFSQLAVPSFPSTWTQLRTRWLMFLQQQRWHWRLPLRCGEVSCPKNCLCRVSYDKSPGDSIAASLQGSPKETPRLVQPVDYVLVYWCLPLYFKDVRLLSSDSLTFTHASWRQRSEGGRVWNSKGEEMCEQREKILCLFPAPSVLPLNILLLFLLYGWEKSICLSF